ncbi:hypothetical protein ACE27K_004795 [Escherichia coli]|uniref:hypothetical protein n=1 Tax=Escherichia coli TaxID=562 RepID=UPI0015E504B8|nr:hypothetical protein [Escherichia coli]EES7241297.1 hypothetical protein [Escherichia coli]EFG2868227.1 hypothetical protein [Escherichia coli]EFK2884203.1 hypothetical protein [Escherichia coli]EGP1996040.1 hypothetical protein [Escherichia coli]
MSVKSRGRDRLPGGRLKSYRRVGSHFTSCSRLYVAVTLTASHFRSATSHLMAVVNIFSR